MTLRYKRDNSSEINGSKFIKQNYRIYILKDALENERIISGVGGSNNGLLMSTKDIKFQWSSVGLVDLIYKDSEEFIKCPICLDSDLIVPKISSCGHVFCWPCIIRYVYTNLEKDYYNRFRCPICYSLLLLKELVSIRYQIVREINVGSTMSFCLLFRDISSSFVRHELFKKASLENKLLFNNEKGAHFQRLGFLSNSNDILIHDFCLLKIKQQEYENDDQLKEELHYINECISILENKLEQQNINILEYEISSKESLNLLLSQYKENEFLEELKNEYMNLTRSSNINNLIEKNFYFYQSHDGQLLFLEPFYVKILQFEFGSIENIPRVLIDVLVTYQKEYILNEYTIKRYKFLDHLPMGSTIKILSIDISSLISKRTQEIFFEKLEKRRLKWYKESISNEDELKLNTNTLKIQKDNHIVNNGNINKTDTIYNSVVINQNRCKYEDNYPMLTGGIISRQPLNLEAKSKLKMSFLNKIKSTEKKFCESFPPLSRSSLE